MKRDAGTASGTEDIDPRIVAFIRRHHVLTLATTAENEVWCANMFYAWLERPKGKGCFVFTSDGQTRHVADMLRNERVAGSVVLESRVVGRLQGLQFQGVMRCLEHGGAEDHAAARKVYLRRFPYAVAVELHLWALEPALLKFTDNRLGFGKKIYWYADGDK